MNKLFPPTQSGSALLVVLSFIAFLSALLFLFFQMMPVEKSTAHALATSYQASLAAESGLTQATAQLSLVTSNNSSFLVGATNSSSANASVITIGTTNLTNTEQLIPLVSGNFSTLSNYFEVCNNNDPTQVVDLNKKNNPIAASASYLAPWVTLKNQSGQPIARYAYILLDEQARLNPSLHQGTPRNDPLNWDHGVETIPLSLGLGNNLLLTPHEAQRALLLASNNTTLESFENIFSSAEEYDAKKIYFTPTSMALPDLIPSTLPDGGNPKYDLNDLATNVTYGSSKTERANNIASIIDRNLPHFKERDPSLLHQGATDQKRYLNRLAACIVDYISSDTHPTCVNGGEPAGQNFTPLITQTAERCALLSRTSNSVTIENQYFVQAWNPYTTAIPAGNTATFVLHNRQRLHFGTAPTTAFQDYEQTNFSTPLLRPNESVVLTFPSVTQIWISPTPVSDSENPRWEKGPEGNADPTQHQPFEFFWNHDLVTMSRRAPVGPGPTDGGLEHDAQSLTNSLNVWQCNFIPTEQDQAGHFRFVGDPRENYLSNYLWKSYSSEKSYVENTRWKGTMSDATAERLFSPATTWIHRDFVPVNPVAGNKPTSISMTPDQVASPYEEARDAPLAPLVIRNGAMNSIGELGNINDPAQADDLGAAPMAGSSDSKSSIYASGGGRTLRIGQPEFSYPNNNWDVPGKRAIELIDLFTVATTNNPSATIIKSDSANGTAVSPIWRQGLINVNTAPHAVLTALFYGIRPTSDGRFTNSTISAATAEELATFVEEHRPYEKLSDLRIITPLLASATTYTPPLSNNVNEEGAPLAAVFDRAREEGFGKMISLCTVQSRGFRAYVLGQSLNASGTPTSEALLEASIALLPKKKETNAPTEMNSLLPVVQKKEWLR